MLIFMANSFKGVLLLEVLIASKTSKMDVTATIPSIFDRGILCVILIPMIFS